jgi:2-oxoglutarate ferredoxin oxidoreductase subunit alpha
MTDIHITVGGAAGQGVETLAYVLAKSLARTGYGICSTRDYMSRVRGGHNFARIRVAQETPWAVEERTDLLIALDRQAYDQHHASLTGESRVIYDPDATTLPPEEGRGIPIRLAALAREAGGAVMANTVAVGAALLALDRDSAATEKLLVEMFGDKPGLPEKNIAALRAGYQAAVPICALDPCLRLPAPAYAPGARLYIEGNEALGLSALASGCRFLAAYPMTPATGIMNYLAAKQGQHDVVVEQAEDEIAALNMVLGAAYAGARSMTVTSGGGFALMVEALSLAGMTETPAVIVVGMRPGPATGLPTRTEQGDLSFALHAGHGEFPRAILSAATLEDAFYRLNQAFDLADQFQTPVIFLSDQNFADTARTIEPYDFGRLVYDRHLVSPGRLERPYRRYAITDSGVSPRAMPGQFAGEVVLADSDEHDEEGHIIEDAKTRRLMMDKRLRKAHGLAESIDEPLAYGDPRPELLLTGWGSTYGALREAVDILRGTGLRAGLLHFTGLWPLPQERLRRAAAKCRLSFCVENNASGQLATIIRAAAGIEIDHLALKYDGRPFAPSEVVREVMQHV